MLSRPTDFSGDILPVLSPADLLSGPAAAAAGLRDHLHLFSGEWWEYADRGNEAFDLITASRVTDRDAPALTSSLVSYILSFPAVRSVSDARVSSGWHSLTFSCTAHTDTGESFPIEFVVP